MTSTSPPLDRVNLQAPSLLDATAFRESLGTPPAWTDPHILFDPSKLPPLLEIPDAKIASKAVRHKTMHQKDPVADLLRPHRYEWDLDSYEIFEVLGDKYLGAAVCRSLRRRYQGLTSGPLSILNQKLVRNDTISYLSLAYGLPSRLVSPRSSDLPPRQDLAADLFEAHIGGLVEYEDQKGVKIGVEEWLEAVFSDSVWPTIPFTAQELRARKIEQERDRTGASLRKKGVHHDRWNCLLCDLELDSVLPKPKFAFDDLDSIKGWHARMYVEDRLISCGRGRGRKDAEIAAANNFAVGMRLPNSDADDGCPQASSPN